MGTPYERHCVPINIQERPFQFVDKPCPGVGRVRGLGALIITEQQNYDVLLLIASTSVIKNQKQKPPGLPDSNVIFFVATKKTK